MKNVLKIENDIDKENLIRFVEFLREFQLAPFKKQNNVITRIYKVINDYECSKRA